MFRVILQKNNVAAKINCDLNKLKSSELKKIKSALNNFGLVYFRNQRSIFKKLFKFCKKIWSAC